MHSLDEALEFEEIGPLKQNFAKPQVSESKQMPSIWVIQWFGILQNLVESISIVARQSILTSHLDTSIPRSI
jgi:hypothetical protein